ncbi:MAG: ATP-dependent DNA helicase RecG, partial [Usitatibacter sp.]
MPATRAPRAPSAPRPAAAPDADSTAARLQKLGIRTNRDLVLHLPLRYEDETKLTPLAEARAGVPVLVEAEVVDSDIKYRPRRTLVVKLTDGERDLWIRFLNFYPSQAKQFTPGKRVRLFGEVRPGFFGDEMVHPKYRIVSKDTPLPKSLTPVYPTTAGLS